MWHKRGLIYCPDGTLWWARSYATIPTVDVLNEDVLRIYYASLDENKYGRIGFIDVDARDPQRILHIAKEPSLDIGDIGQFDDCGVNASCVITLNHKKHLYYIGWQRCERVPYMLFSGLAVSDDGNTFSRLQTTPILDRTPQEPFSRSAPFVLKEDNQLKMWYWSCLQWTKEDKDTLPRYNNVIRYAASTDGIHWSTHEHVCLTPDFNNEYSVGRPWVVKEHSTYKMWYSIRGRATPYKMGYAESPDGIVWTKKEDPEMVITPSQNGWDSEMVCYPCIVDVDTRRYLFYNGNRHGASGFGYAVFEKS